MRDKILIVGGYGQVGTYVTLQLLTLLDNSSDKIIVAGRSLEKANEFAKAHNNEFKTLKLDIYDVDSIAQATKNVKVAVMCISPKNNCFAEHCVKNSIHYVDISPSNDISQTIQGLQQKAIDNHSTCVLGVGIAPGLSNLLVKELSEHTDVFKNVNVHLLLGVGEKHGADGVKWLLDNINHTFLLKTNDVERTHTPFIEKNKTVFMEPLGEREAYRFNLADQYIVPQTLGVESASSYFCYDSKFITQYVSILKRIGIFALLKFKIGYMIMLKLFTATLSLMQTLKIGTDIYGIQVDAVAVKNGVESPCHIGTIGHNNSQITGHIAAFVATKLFAGNQPCGVFYLEELFSLKDINDFGIRPKIDLFV